MHVGQEVENIRVIVETMEMGDTLRHGVSVNGSGEIRVH